MAPEAPANVLGYYTISPGAIAFANVPATITRKLGRYEVPVFRLGRLAVSTSVRVVGSAATSCWRQANVRSQWPKKVGGGALAIDAKDKRAAAWHEPFGALPLLDDPLRPVLPLDTIRATLRG